MKQVERNLFVADSGLYYVIWRKSAGEGGKQRQKSLRTPERRVARLRLQRLRRLGMNWEQSRLFGLIP